jgi:uncharacterized membrane protein
MNGKGRWLLWSSLILNLFLVAAIAGGAYVFNRHVNDIRPPLPIAQQWQEATKDMTPEARERICNLIKQSALSGETDMNKARELRAEAAKLAGDASYDAGHIAALSDEARGYEDQARAKVENALIQGMAKLTPDERKIVANHLLRASFRFRYFLMKDGMKEGMKDSGAPPAKPAEAPAKPLP